MQSGDTLTSIAVAFGVSLQALEAANLQIKDANHIYPGQAVTVLGACPRLLFCSDKLFAPCFARTIPCMSGNLMG